MTGRIVLACGGYRTGSTLQYNLVGEYAERINSGRRIGFVEPEQAALLDDVWSFVEALGVAVAKCHLAPGVDERSDAWRRLCEGGCLVPVYTVRDWRDVVHSWSRKFDQDLEAVFAHPRWALNLANLEAWLSLGAQVQRYETLVDDPSTALRDLAGWADLPVDDDALASAAGAAGRPARPAGTVDARTLVHHDHIGEPGGGGWREWSERDRAFVAPRIAALMERFGYAWDED